MIGYQFHPTLVLRLPIYSYLLYADTSLGHILKQDFFQKAVYIASEAFYNELQKVDFEITKLDKKAFETLAKYFNRMCFRPTPFGLYSGIGAVSWGDEISNIQFSDQNVEPNIRFSYAKNLEYAGQLFAGNREHFIYKPNTTLYKTGSEYRFIKSSSEGLQVDFIIDSLKTDRFFEQLISFLNPGRTLAEVSTYVIGQAACSTDEAGTYILWLIDNQVISHQYEPNITGEDYLHRLLTHGFAHVHTVTTALNQLEQITSIKNLHTVPGSIQQELGEVKNSDLYVNLKVNFPDGKLAAAYQQDIIGGIACLDKLSPPGLLAPGLTEFIKNFNLKFDGQTIPLLTALDPEVGVGYNDLAVAGDDANIAKNIVQGVSKSENRPINWGDAHTMLFKKWQTLQPGKAIEITDEDLKNITQGETNNPSPSISVMFRIVDDKVLIENAGGSTATALVGRFTPLNHDIHQLAVDMAAKETANNPDIIFAEIAHICHSHTANIDRREHIYSYEIPVLVQSTSPAENQILLSDLWVSVVKGNITLQSKKHGKRVVPRLSSAFNYARNDLAVFRFLCDLQSAGIKTKFNFNLSQYFPGMDFYPRMVYKNTILQLAYWNVKKDVFDPIFKAAADDKKDVFKSIREQYHLPRHIALSQSDNQLVFDLDRVEDVLFFLETVKNQKDIKIAEFLYPHGKPIVTGNHGKPHINQFITSLYHRRQVYEPLKLASVSSHKVLRSYIPGSEWLYFKIYCHPVRANELLGGPLYKAVKKLSADGLISQWFFIRYLDPGYHIRIRLKVLPQQLQLILSSIQKALSKYVDDGIIGNLVIDSYQRELERYGPEMMVESEAVFHTSSNLILSFLNKKQPAEAADILTFAVVSVGDILSASGLDDGILIGFLDRVFNSFYNEFNTIDNLKYQLDTEYRKQKPIIEQAYQQAIHYYQEFKLSKTRQLFIGSVTVAVSKIDSLKKGRKEKWLADVIHMHLNRIFTSDPRKQEMTVYYFLLKYIRSVHARNKSQK